MKYDDGIYLSSSLSKMELIYELLWQIPNTIDKSEIVQVLN